MVQNLDLYVLSKRQYKHVKGQITYLFLPRPKIQDNMTEKKNLDLVVQRVNYAVQQIVHYLVDNCHQSKLYCP